jgi:hypothetical protein
MCYNVSGHQLKNTAQLCIEHGHGMAYARNADSPPQAIRTVTLKLRTRTSHHKRGTLSQCVTQLCGYKCWHIRRSHPPAVAAATRNASPTRHVWRSQFYFHQAVPRLLTASGRSSQRAFSSASLSACSCCSNRPRCCTHAPGSCSQADAQCGSWGWCSCTGNCSSTTGRAGDAAAAVAVAACTWVPAAEAAAAPGALVDPQLLAAALLLDFKAPECSCTAAAAGWLGVASSSAGL